MFSYDDQVKNKLQVSGWSTQTSGDTVNYQHILQKIQISRPRKPECILIYDMALRKNQYCAFGIPKTARVTWVVISSLIIHLSVGIFGIKNINHHREMEVDL